MKRSPWDIVSWPKTKVQVFRGLLDETLQSVHGCAEDVEILENFIYHGSVLCNARWIGLILSVMDSLGRSIWHCRNLERRISQSIMGGMRLGARCPAAPSLAVMPHESPCRLPSHTE